MPYSPPKFTGIAPLPGVKDAVTLLDALVNRPKEVQEYLVALEKNRKALNEAMENTVKVEKIAEAQKDAEAFLREAKEAKRVAEVELASKVSKFEAEVRARKDAMDLRQENLNRLKDEVDEGKKMLAILAENLEVKEEILKKEKQELDMVLENRVIAVKLREDKVSEKEKTLSKLLGELK
jgi:chromosome segregation ATPase